MFQKNKQLGIFTLALLLLSTATPLMAQTPQRPFPMQGRWVTGNHQVARPTNFTQAQMNQHVITRYNTYKNELLERVPGGNFYIRAGGTPSTRPYVTQSEAHGFGMIVFALMAGHDPEAKAIFDGMNRLRMTHPSNGRGNNTNTGQMGWLIFRENIAATSQISNADRVASATDGDLDMAYALLLAHAQWGSTPGGRFDYMAQALEIIRGLQSFVMTTGTGTSHRTRLGDWSTNNSNTRSSDWMVGHFRAFAAAETNTSNRNFWLAAVDTVYSVLGRVSHSTTGLMPDFATGNPPVPDPRCGNANEGGLNCEAFNYNACRTPWRIATDWIHHAEPRSRTSINRMSEWLRGSTSGNAANIRAGYYLDGRPLRTFYDVAFAAPFTTAMMGGTSQANQDFLNASYDRIRQNSGGGSYGRAINLLNLLMITGNWWYPHSALVGGNPGENRTPTDILLAQNNLVAPVAAGARIGTLSAVDAETQAASTYTFSLVSGDSSTHNARFAISGANLNVGATALDAGTYSVRVRVTDSLSTQTPIWFEKVFTITVAQPARQRQALPASGTVDLVRWEDWEAQVDPRSEVSVEHEHTAGPLVFTLDRGAQPDGVFTWAQLGAYFRAGGRFEQINYITIEYSSQRPVHIVIGDSVLTANGTSHEFLLPRVGGFETVTIPLTDFAQPSWVSAGSRAAINKARVSGILISAQSANSQTEGVITRLILSETSPTVSISAPQAASRINAATPITVAQNSINLNIRGESSVELRIADVRGRQLFSENIKLNGGVGSLTIPATIARNQALILNVRGENGVNITQRFLLQ